MSSILWTSILAGKDPESTTVEDPNTGKSVDVNSVGWGYENFVNSMVKALNELNAAPKDIVFAVEGMHSKKRRLMINPEYKAQRGKRVPEYYKVFSDVKDKVLQVFGNLGSTALSQSFVEGDDLVAWLCRETEEDAVVMSNDTDLAALTQVNAYGANVEVRISSSVGLNKYPCLPENIVVYKALVGDSSDNISGVVGFGPKAFDEFFKLYGEPGLTELKRLALLGNLKELADDEHKIVKRICQGEHEFINSFELARLRPEWVDTMQNPLEWTAGLIHGTCPDDRLNKWAPASYLVTAAKWDSFVAWAQPLIFQGPVVALDIETSTPEESDAWQAENGVAVDVIGSKISGMSLTFGKNLQHTVYMPVDHKDTDNCDVTKLADFVMTLGKTLIIHNTNFEGPVLYQEWGDRFLNNGYNGFLPGWIDSKFMASYVDENSSLGLKKLAKMYFDYDQTTYEEVTTIEGAVGDFDGEVFDKVLVEAVWGKDADNRPVMLTPAVTEKRVRKHVKMRELTGKHVKDYACDDTIVTASLYNYLKLRMHLEHTWITMLKVEINASYLHAQSFVHGTRVDLGKLSELADIDAKIRVEAEAVLDAYLIEHGWDGTVAPVYKEVTPAAVKEACLLTGIPLETQFRKLDKIAELIPDKLLSSLVAAGDAAGLTAYVGARFKARPNLNLGSPLQVAKLLYDVMKTPVAVRNPLSATAKEKGEREGSPGTGELALQYALRDVAPDAREALLALKAAKSVKTKDSLYYGPYPKLVHWKTGRLHSSHNQCATNTRRASSSAPNFQQMPKHPKVEGQPARFREVIIPHKRKAVIVSMDFAAQELRVIADYSRDENMLACFMGDNLKDMHALTGLGICNSKHEDKITYEEFMERLHAGVKVIKECRVLGKKVNFTTEFGAQAKKLAATLLISEAEAQSFIEAKELAFPAAVTWKEGVIAEAKSLGYVRLKGGAVRHLRSLLNSSDNQTASKAERQSVNALVQGSAAEMTKLAEGRMWSRGLEQHFDCQIIGPIHDEVIASVHVDCLIPFLKEMHACMVAHYADMFVPIRSSISIGKNFGEQIEVGEAVDEEAVTNALEIIFGDKQ